MFVSTECILKGTLAVAYWYLLKVRERGAAELASAPGSYKHEYSQDSPVWWVLDTGLPRQYSCL